MNLALAFVAILASAQSATAQPAAPREPAAVDIPPCRFAQTGTRPLFVGVTALEMTATCPAISYGAGTVHNTYFTSVTTALGTPSAVTTVHVVAIDLTQAGLSFQASTGTGTTFHTTRPTDYLTRTGAQVAFNANLFSGCCSNSVSKATTLAGLEIGGGHLYSPAGTNPDPAQAFPFNTSLAAAGATLRILPSYEVDAETTDAAVTGSHLLVSSGNNIAPPMNGDGDFFETVARTVVGLSADNQTFWVAAVDGQAPSTGLTLPQAAELMLNLGAATALNLDGGGSTALAVQGADGTPQLLNRPSDPANHCTDPVNGGCERYVGAIFAVTASPLVDRPRRRR